MTTDELLVKLPPLIGRNKVFGCGKILGYTLDDKEGSSLGWLYLHNNGRYWFAYYGNKEDILCLDPESKIPNDNVFTYGKTPNEALQKLYDWCVKNGYIKKKDMIYVRERDNKWHNPKEELPPTTTDIEFIDLTGVIRKGKIVSDMSGWYLYLEGEGWDSMNNIKHWRFL